MELTWQRTGTILFFVLILGTALRFYDLGGNSFVADEFLDMNSSYGYMQTGQWQAWDFNFGKPADMNQNAARDERAFVYKWQVAELFRFLPPTEGVARSVSAFWGVASILVVFWAAWFYTRRKEIGLIAAILFAVSVSALVMDRRLRMYAMFFPVYLAFATTFFAFFERAYLGKWKLGREISERYGLNAVYFLPMLFLGALSLHVHQLTGNIGIVIAAYLAVMALRVRKDSGWKNKYAICFGLGLLALVALAVGLPGLMHSFAKELGWFDNHYSYFGYAFADFGAPLLGAVIAGWGAWFLWKGEGRDKESLWLTLSFVVPLAMAVWFWRRNAGPQYIFFAQSFLMIITAAGIFGLFRFVSGQKDVFGKYAGGILLVLAALLLPSYGYFFQENNTYHETSSGSNPNYRKIFGYFKKNQEPGDALITRNFRNYYFSGSHVPVYDFGGELSTDKLSLASVQDIMREHPTGWVILSGNDYDYISHDAEDFFRSQMTRVSNSQVRGDAEVYRWGR